MRTSIIGIGTFLIVADNFGDFSIKYGHSGAFSLSDVLWTCSDMLAKRLALGVRGWGWGYIPA
jgi:hypothetical protein